MRMSPNLLSMYLYLQRRVEFVCAHQIWNLVKTELYEKCSDLTDDTLYNETMHGMLPGVRCGRLVNGKPRWCYLPEKYLCDHELDCFFGKWLIHHVGHILVLRSLTVLYLRGIASYS